MVDLVLTLVSVPLVFAFGYWRGVRSMGRNLHTVLAALTPEEMRTLARRTQAQKVLTGQLPPPKEPPAA